MKIGILGSGALGSAVGGSLALAGNDVELWDINEAHMRAVNDNGLKFDAVDGNHVIPLFACRPEEGHAQDLIILMTKTCDSDAALTSARRHIEAGAMVMSAQNGLGNEVRLAAHVPQEQLLYGCTMMPARFLDYGHVASQAVGRIVFGAKNEVALQKAAQFAQTSAHFTLEFAPDRADTVIWQKAAFNCGMNAVNALTGGRVKSMANNQDARDLVQAVASEVVAVARAGGVSAEYQPVFDHLANSMAKHGEHKASMLQDIEGRRPTEIDSLCAEVARQGEDLGVPTPLNKTLATLVTLKSDVLNGDYL